MFLAKSLVNHPHRVTQLADGYRRYVGIIGITAALVLIQPHMSGAMVIALSGCIVLFAAGFKIKYFVVSIMGAAPLVYTLIMTGEFYNAKNLLKIKTIKESLENKTIELSNLIKSVKNIKQLSSKELKELFKDNEYCLNFYVQYYKDLKNQKEKDKLVNKFNKIYSDFGESLYIYGLNLIENNKIEEGIEILKTATTKTRNGLIVLEINKLINKYEK